MPPLDRASVHVCDGRCVHSVVADVKPSAGASRRVPAPRAFWQTHCGRPASYQHMALGHLTSLQPVTETACPPPPVSAAVAGVGPLAACPLQGCNTADGLKGAWASHPGRRERGRVVGPAASPRHGFLGPKAHRRSTHHRDPKPRRPSSPSPRMTCLNQNPGERGPDQPTSERLGADNWSLRAPTGRLDGWRGDPSGSIGSVHTSWYEGSDCVVWWPRMPYSCGSAVHEQGEEERWARFG